MSTCIDACSGDGALMPIVWLCACHIHAHPTQHTKPTRTAMPLCDIRVMLCLLHVMGVLGSSGVGLCVARLWTHRCVGVTACTEKRHGQRCNMHVTVHNNMLVVSDSSSHTLHAPCIHIPHSHTSAHLVPALQTFR